MKATGQINITEELILQDPTMEIVNVNYDWVNNTVDVEMYFSEGAFKHSRTFQFDIDEGKEYSSTDIMELIQGHEVLGQFK